MPKRIEYEGKVHEFPDDFSDAEIQAALSPAPKSAAGFASNVVSSGERMVGDLAHAVTNPGQTLNALGAIPVGIYDKLGGPVLKDEHGNEDHSSAEMLDKMWGALTQRYGSHEKIRETIYNDPVGVAADLSFLLGGGGFAARGLRLGAEAAGATRTAAIVGTLGKALSTASAVTDPVQLAGRAGGVVMRTGPVSRATAAVGAKVSEKATRLMEEALRPNKGQYSLAESRELAQTALENGLSVREGNLAKIWDIIDGLNTKVESTLKNKAAQGATVESEAIAQRIDQVKPQFETFTPGRSQKVLDNAKEEFLRDVGGAQPGKPAGAPQPTGVLDANGNPIMTAGTPATPPKPGGPIPVDEAHARKVNTYREVKDDYGKMATAEVEAKKALARGAAEEIKAAIPELAEPLGKEGKLLDLAPVFEAAIRRNPAIFSGMKSALAAVVTQQLTGSAKAAVVAGALQGLMKHPYVRSRVAIAINRAQQLNPSRYGPPRMATALARFDDYAESLSGQPTPDPAR